MAVEFDLLGDPIPSNRGEQGRPVIMATAENINKIRVLMIAGLPKKRIAEELGISIPTLNRVYFASGKISVRHARAMAIAEARAKNLLQITRAADGGSVPAMKVMRTVLEEAERSMFDDAAAVRTAAHAAPTPMRAGKKESARAAAMEAEDELTELFGARARH